MFHTQATRGAKTDIMNPTENVSRETFVIIYKTTEGVYKNIAVFGELLDIELDRLRADPTVITKSITYQTGVSE